MLGPLRGLHDAAFAPSRPLTPDGLGPDSQWSSSSLGKLWSCLWGWVSVFWIRGRGGHEVKETRRRPAALHVVWPNPRHAVSSNGRPALSCVKICHGLSEKTRSILGLNHAHPIPIPGFKELDVNATLLIFLSFAAYVPYSTSTGNTADTAFRLNFDPSP